MTTTLRDIAAAIVAIEESISIEDPVTLTASAYPYLAPGRDGLNLPCWMNTYRLEAQLLGPNGYRVRNLTVFAQFLVAEALKDPQGDSEIAAAFLDAALLAFAANVQLDAAVQITLMNVRGNQERTLGIFEWNGIPYVGLDLAFDVRIDDVVTVGP